MVLTKKLMLLLFQRSFKSTCSMQAVQDSTDQSISQMAAAVCNSLSQMLHWVIANLA